MAARHTPLLAALALAAICASGPAAAAPRPPEAASLRPPAVPDVRPAVPGASGEELRLPGVSGRGVRLPGVSIDRKAGPRPRVSVPGVSVVAPRPRKIRPRPEVSMPGVRTYDDAVCVEGPSGGVLVGRCGPAAEPGRTRQATPTRIGTPIRMDAPAPVRPTPTPTPTPTVTEARAYAPQTVVPHRRPNPLATVLIMVVLTTVIASTTAVAFGAVR